MATIQLIAVNGLGLRPTPVEIDPRGGWDQGPHPLLNVMADEPRVIERRRIDISTFGAQPPATVAAPYLKGK